MTSGLFWDASALVKAYLEEEGTANAKGAVALQNVWGFVTDFVALEVISALGKKLRSGQITRKTYRRALEAFLTDFPTVFTHLVIDSRTVKNSHHLAEKYRALGTSAMDILHLASAHQAAAICHPKPLVMLCADRPLLEAARAEGLGIYNPEMHPHSALRNALELRNWARRAQPPHRLESPAPHIRHPVPPLRPRPRSPHSTAIGKSFHHRDLDGRPFGGEPAGVAWRTLSVTPPVPLSTVPAVPSPQIRGALRAAEPPAICRNL